MDFSANIRYDSVVAESKLIGSSWMVRAGLPSQSQTGEQAMEKEKQPTNRRVPQLKIRTSLVAGGSLENCQQNLSYWQKRYNQMCRLK